MISSVARRQIERTCGKGLAGNVNSLPAAREAALVAASAHCTKCQRCRWPEDKGPRRNHAPEGLRISNDGTDPAGRIHRFVVTKASDVATNSKTSKPIDGALLTEEQILKMDEKDYMNQTQLAFFKSRLKQLERDLLKNADETTEHLRETVLVPDPADRATIEEEHALELRTRDRERKLLKKVQQSLHSIDSGDYGWCEETGEPIGIPRLLARPTATLSLEAQQRRELKQKLYGD